MVGKLRWPLLVVAESDEGVHEVPFYVECETNEVQGNANFLMGLDLQRYLKIRVDVVSNTCTMQCDSGKLRKLELAQVAGSGLLCVRIDRFEEARRYCQRNHITSQVERALSLNTLGDDAIGDIKRISKAILYLKESIARTRTLR